MSKIYSTDLSKIKEKRAALHREYSKLSEKWKRCWSENSENLTLIMQIQNDIKKIYREIRETENSQNLLSAEQRKILHDADLDTLKKLYRKCKREKVPYGDLVSAIEEEIYQKYFKENNIKVDRIYKLEKFVPNKKE
jgi:septal ring factor EnvC (AmiA/AmiB activator)